MVKITHYFAYLSTVIVFLMAVADELNITVFSCIAPTAKHETESSVKYFYIAGDIDVKFM